ncbi:MAG: thioredoxin family protein [Gemmatimonadota bacterium]|nr:MAG: thioredoxin family protein [Gemmatimonadota bacterium]
MPIITLVNETELGRVLDKRDTVLVDFWAPWCPPCKEFVPVFEAAAARHPDITFCRVNTEEAGDLAQAFDVVSIPTLVAIRERIMIASQPGSLPEHVLEDLITKIKGLDMDELRREMAAAAEGDQES